MRPMADHHGYAAFGPDGEVIPGTHCDDDAHNELEAWGCLIWEHEAGHLRDLPRVAVKGHQEARAFFCSHGYIVRPARVVPLEEFEQIDEPRDKEWTAEAMKAWRAKHGGE